MEGIVLSEDTYNKIMAVVNNSGPIPVDNPGLNQTHDYVSVSDYVWAFNNSGADIGSGTPVDFLEPYQDAYDGWQNNKRFNCTASTDDTEVAGVTVEDIPDQSIGLVKVSGLCVVSGVAIINTTDKYVKIDSDGNLTTSTGGPMAILGTLTSINTFYGGVNADILVNLSQPSTNKPTSGIVRGLAQSTYGVSDAEVDVEITFSNVEGVDVGMIVTATNHIGLEGNSNAKVLVYAHGDDEGENQTFDLINGECPV